MQPTVRERIAVNKQLQKLGFGGLDDPTLVKQIAFCIRSHEAFRAILMGCTAENRAKAYHSLAPNLTHFVPKPLDVYEREVQEKAEREQWDIWDGSAYPKPFKVGEVFTDEYKLAREAEDTLAQKEHQEKHKGVLEMVCIRCTVAEYFPAQKRRDATKAAHAAGWRTEDRNGQKKSFCPKHVPGRAWMKLLCGTCYTEERIRVWDEQDGYRDARLLGWIFGDVPTCPKCATKPAIVQ